MRLEKTTLKKLIVYILISIVLIFSGICIGYLMYPEEDAPVNTGYALNPAYEYIVGAAVWQMSAEAHAMMVQSFNLAERNIDNLVALADSNQQGYHWVEENGQKKLYLDDKRVAVICDIDDTLVDGVHYTANILGKNGEWTNKSFTDFIQSPGCTAIPGALQFTNHAVDNGIALFYVTNRYDQGYKQSEAGYDGQEGYKKADGTVIGSSTYDIFGKTMYDITMESLASLGFPINNPGSTNYCEDAILLVNDNKLNGSSKEGLRQGVQNGGELKSGERVEESNAYPETIDDPAHHVAMFIGDDLNDISQIFSDSKDAVDRVALAIDNADRWGTEWIVLPNAVYGSFATFASQYGYRELFEAFDYTDSDNEVWNLYK